MELIFSYMDTGVTVFGMLMMRSTQRIMELQLSWESVLKVILEYSTSPLYTNTYPIYFRWRMNGFILIPQIEASGLRTNEFMSPVIIKFVTALNINFFLHKISKYNILGKIHIRLSCLVQNIYTVLGRDIDIYFGKCIITLEQTKGSEY